MKSQDKKNAKLTQCQVVEIREIAARREAMKSTISEMTNAKLGETYGVSKEAIREIVIGYSWKRA